MRFLGVDVGGTSTRALVVDADGRGLGYAVAGSGNPTASGVEPAAHAIATAAGEAIRRAGVSADDITASVAGIAGAGGSLGVRLRAALADAGMIANLHFEGDLLATFCSGTLEQRGYALVAGTGAVAARIADGRLEAVRDGLGWLLGDRGSGFWIGRRVVRSAMATLDRQEPPSVLAELLIGELDVDPALDPWAGGRPQVVREVTDRLYQLRPADLARFTPLAFAAADRGDAQARAILDEAALELARTLAGVLAAGLPGPIVVGGSVLSQQPSMVAAVADHLRAAGATAPLTTVDDGLVGAAVLAMRRGGVEVGLAHHEMLRTSVVSLR